MVITTILCSRCREEVAPGAPWCPHCGYDMTAHGAIELNQTLASETGGGLLLPLDCLLHGIGAALTFGILQLALLAVAPRLADAERVAGIILLLLYCLNVTNAQLPRVIRLAVFREMLGTLPRDGEPENVHVGLRVLLTALSTLPTLALITYVTLLQHQMPL